MEDSTQNRILDAAESLFIEFGYAGTSMRAITEKAGVNLAAINYHFGSKEGLFAATVHRRMASINSSRLSRLEALLNSETGASVEGILEAFFAPILPGKTQPELQRLIARIHAEPPALVGPILEQEFGDIVNRFISALQQVMPGVAKAKIAFQLNMSLGVMLQVMHAGPIVFTGITGMSHQQKMQQLMAFCSQGMKLLETPS
ncbi:MAG: TetR/AcrR family transcriptional regulator [Pseudomonadales bacterium]|nr:TetR/AcrR family transcriptional regulator [Pseudomonadales bacterium]